MLRVKGKEMTYRRRVTGFAILLMFLVGVSPPPFVHSSSRPLFQDSQEVAEEMVADNVESQLEWNRKEGGFVEESARKVPTGPDPLHHNNKPARP